MATINPGLGKIQFIGTYGGVSTKWTENLAYTPINFGNPNTTQDVTIDGQQVTGVDTDNAAEDLKDFCRALANLTNGTFADLIIRYDVNIY